MNLIYPFLYSVYVDAVINHMVYADLEGVGTGGSSYNSFSDSMSFPGVPWVADDFNCCQEGYECSEGAQQCSTNTCNIESYQDPIQVLLLLYN